jgi:hypothetical protein
VARRAGEGKRDEVSGEIGIAIREKMEREQVKAARAPSGE